MIARGGRRAAHLKTHAFGYGLLAPTLALLAVVLVWPVLQAVSMSVQRLRLTAPEPARFVGLDNYAALLRDPVWWSALRTTLIWTSANLVAQMVLGTLLALLLNERLRARGGLRSAVLIPWIVPSVAAALIWRWLFDGSAGLVNALLVKSGLIHDYVAWLGNPQTALPAVILESVWKGTPFVFVVVLAALQTIPAELNEAAAIDGAGSLQRLWRITLPAIRPTLAIAAILTVVYTVNNFNAIWLMTQGGPLHTTEILFTYAYQIAFQRFDFGLAAAMSVVLFLILLVPTAAYLFLVERSEE